MGNCNNCIDEKGDKDVRVDHFGQSHTLQVKSRVGVQRENPDAVSPTFDLPAPHQEQAVDVEFRDTRKPVQASSQPDTAQPQAVAWQPEDKGVSRRVEEVKVETHPAPEPEVARQEALAQSRPVPAGSPDVQTLQNTLRILFAKKTVREFESNQKEFPDPQDKKAEPSSSAAPQDFLVFMSRECRATYNTLPKYKFTFAVRGVSSYPPRALGDGSIYVGQWASVGGGLYRKGKGRLYKSDGSYQEGYWVGPRLHFHGRIISVNGDYYEGGVQDGLRHGDGLFRSFDQRTEYRGNWANDMKHGEGKEQKPDSSVYVGSFDRNERNGKGRLTMSDGKEYTGGFLAGKYNGQGVHTWRDGRRYEGEWKNGLMHGYGKFVYPDGKTYEGMYANDKKNGKGVYKWEGKIYDGDWVDGKMHGVGWLTSDKGKKKYEFRNGERGKEVRE